MTDNQNWQAPGQPASASQPPQYGSQPPRYGQYAPPQAGAPQAPGPAWTPPPKPGLIPLRPLSFGTLIGAPFQVLRRNPKVTVGSALLIVGLPQAVATLLLYGGIYLLVSRVQMAAAGDRGAIIAGAVGGGILLALVYLAVNIVSGAVFQGIIVNEVARETLGERLTAGSLWRLCRPRIRTLLLWTLLVFLAVVAGILILTVLVVLVALVPHAGVVLGVLLAVFGGLGAVVLWVWLTIKLTLVPSIIMLERRPIRASMRRSWRLTGGYFWRTFGVIALIAVIVWGVLQIITTPIALVGTYLTFLTNPTAIGSANESLSQTLLSQLGIQAVSTVVSLIIGSILSVVQSSAHVLIYLDLRMRKEGLDLGLARFVEARQTGAGQVADPYLVDDAPVEWPPPSPTEVPSA